MGFPAFFSRPTSVVSFPVRGGARSKIEWRGVLKVACPPVLTFLIAVPEH